MGLHAPGPPRYGGTYRRPRLSAATRGRRGLRGEHQRSAAEARTKAISERVVYLLDRLDAAGVPQHSCRERTGIVERRRGLREKLEPVYEDRDPIWIVGEVEWDHGHGTGRDGPRFRRHLTGVTRHGELVAVSEPTRPGDCRIDPEGLLELLEAYAAGHGVPVEAPPLPPSPD